MNIKSVDLNLLVAFHALMSERSVTRAAVRLGLSQPALSNALGRLRKQYADPLFVRVRSGMLPTTRALDLLPNIEAALHHIGATLERPKFQSESSNRAFRIATTDEIELLLLPALLRELSIVAPGVTVNCKRLQGLFETPESDLQSGALDFAMGRFPYPPSVESGLYEQALYEDRAVCIARVGHPTVRRRVLSLAQFIKLKHVVTFYPGEGPGLIDRILSELGHRRKIALTLPHCLTVPFVVAQSDLIATVPDSVVHALGPTVRLQRMRCPVSVPTLRVNLAWHVRTHEEASHKWFRDLVAAVSRRLVRTNVSGNR